MTSQEIDNLLDKCGWSLDIGGFSFLYSNEEDFLANMEDEYKNLPTRNYNTDDVSEDAIDDTGMTISEFLQLCSKLTDEQIKEVSKANNPINKLKSFSLLYELPIDKWRWLDVR